ncbi:hypothetical protein ACLOJK_036637 [Asimina triloba]
MLDSTVQQMTYYNQDPTGNFYPYTYNYDESYLPNHYGTDQQDQSQNYQQLSYFEQEPTVELPSLEDPFHSQEVDQSFADKFQGDMEEGDIESAKTELEGHDKGKKIHYEDFSKYQPKVPFPSALEGKPIGKQKLDQNEDSSDQMFEKEGADETKAQTEAKFNSQMEEAEKVEQELPQSCILVTSSTPPSINLNEEEAPQVKVKASNCKFIQRMCIIAGTPRSHHTLMNEHQIAIPCRSTIQWYSIFPSSRPPFSPTPAAANGQTARRRRDSGSNNHSRTFSSICHDSGTHIPKIPNRSVLPPICIFIAIQQRLQAARPHRLHHERPPISSSRSAILSASIRPVDGKHPHLLPSPSTVSHTPTSRTHPSCTGQQSAIAMPPPAMPDHDCNNSFHDHHRLHHEPAASAQWTAQIPFCNTDDHRSSSLHFHHPSNNVSPHPPQIPVGSCHPNGLKPISTPDFHPTMAKQPIPSHIRSSPFKH